ncbi:hypothetical protein [Candidatus Binatus soli]|jgi:hypothetical protein|uniref:hypothetical protein n=1 Tax=Candidatus Binatus soli TaxID=1953413 RepID=UPI003D0E4729
MPIDLRFDSNEVPLLTDLCELTMAARYFALLLNGRDLSKKGNRKRQVDYVARCSGMN